MPELRVKNLFKKYGNNTIIDRISFEVSEGEFCILLGPSGCGKSTILRLIAGLDQQDDGEILIDSREISGLTPRQRDIAMVFQSYALYPHMTVFENMAFPLRMRKIPRQETEQKVHEAASLLNIRELLDRKPAELSGGQRQRVAIGRAIVRNPKVFLFDEPLSNLDAKLRGTMRVELAGLHRRLRATTIYVTHDQTEAMTLGQKIILLDKGEIQQIGTPMEIYERPENLFVASFIGVPPINLIAGRLELADEKARFRSPDISFDVGKKEALLSYDGTEVTAGIRPEALTPGEGPLSGELEHLEHIGHETILYIRTGETELIAKAGPGFNGKPGDKVSLSLNLSGLHFFQGETRIITL